MQKNTLKVVSLNIEKDKHVPEVLTFLKEENPDVVCLQEIFKETFELLIKELNVYGVFDPQAVFKNELGIKYVQGVAILSKHLITEHDALKYTDNTEKEEDHVHSLNHHPEQDKDKSSVNKQYTRRVLVAKILKEGEEFTLATTHFTWGYYGHVDIKSREFIWEIDETLVEEQTQDAERLFKIFNTLGEFIFCVDSNSPRGEKVFDLFAEKLKDNVPEIYRTSIDGLLHRAGPLPLMVDSIFTTKQYLAKNVVLKSGISDHMAVIGEIYK